MEHVHGSMHTHTHTHAHAQQAAGRNETEGDRPNKRRVFPQEKPLGVKATPGKAACCQAKLCLLIAKRVRAETTKRNEERLLISNGYLAWQMRRRTCAASWSTRTKRSDQADTDGGLVPPWVECALIIIIVVITNQAKRRRQTPTVVLKPRCLVPNVGQIHIPHHHQASTRHARPAVHLSVLDSLNHTFLGQPNSLVHCPSFAAEPRNSLQLQQLQQQQLLLLLAAAPPYFPPQVPPSPPSPPLSSPLLSSPHFTSDPCLLTFRRRRQVPPARSGGHTCMCHAWSSCQPHCFWRGACLL